MLYMSLILVFFFVSCNNNEVKEDKQNIKFVYVKEKSQPKTKICKQKTVFNKPYKFSNVKYLYNYDGDTVRFTIRGVHPLLGQNIAIRLAGIDTAEIKTKNFCEKEKAKIAKKLVHKILSKAKSISLKNCIRGKYFRLVCTLIADHKDLSKILLDKGLAVPYDGGHKRKVDWCRM